MFVWILGCSALSSLRVSFQLAKSLCHSKLMSSACLSHHQCFQRPSMVTGKKVGVDSVDLDLQETLRDCCECEYCSPRQNATFPEEKVFAEVRRNSSISYGGMSPNLDPERSALWRFFSWACISYSPGVRKEWQGSEHKVQWQNKLVFCCEENFFRPKESLTNAFQFTSGSSRI